MPSSGTAAPPSTTGPASTEVSAAANAATASAAAAAASASAAAASTAAAASASARAVAASATAARLATELDHIRSAMAEYRALQPRAAALLHRLVRGTAGWGLDSLDRLRHQVLTIVEGDSRGRRRGGRGAPSRSAVLDEVAAELEAWGV